MNHQLPEVLPGRHYLAWVAGGFLAGVFYGIYGTSLHGLPWKLFLCYSAVFLLVAGLLLLLIFFCLRQCNRIGTDLVTVWLICAFFVLGIGRVYLFELWENQSLKATAETERQYQGVLLTDPEASSSGASFGATVFVTHVVEEDGSLTPTKGNIKLYAKEPLYHGIGFDDTIIFTAHLTTPQGEVFPGGFSYRHALYRQNIRYSYYTTELASAKTPVTLTHPSYHLERLGRQIRQSVFDAIDQSFGSANAESALLKALMLGNRESFVDEQTEAFVDSGLIHITAASGMHLLFLFGFLTFCFRKLSLPSSLVRVLILPILFLFAASASFTPSICRAVIMMSLMLIANQLQREPDSLTSLAFAAMVLATQNPYIVTGYSFLLSFSATLGIVVFATPLKNASPVAIFPGKLRFFSHLHKSIHASMVLSLAANLGVGYFTARFFNRFIWGSLLANVLLIPFASYSFVGGICLWLCCFFSPPLAAFFAQWLLRWPLWMMNRIAEFFSHPHFRIELPTPHPSFLILYLLLLTLFYHYVSVHQKKK